MTLSITSFREKSQRSKGLAPKNLSANVRGRSQALASFVWKDGGWANAYIQWCESGFRVVSGYWNYFNVHLKPSERVVSSSKL